MLLRLLKAKMHMCSKNTCLVLIIGDWSNSFTTAVNGFDHHIDLGVSKILGEPSSLTTKTASSTAAPSAKIGGPQDRRAVLVHIASRPWIDKADDDLRPMISLDKEAPAA